MTSNNNYINNYVNIIFALFITFRYNNEEIYEEKTIIINYCITNITSKLF